VTPGYFAAAGVRVLAGRDFTAADGPGSPAVAIIDRSLARRVFGRDDVVGSSIGVDGGIAEIVAVVDEVRPAGPAEPTRPTVYRPLPQAPRRRFALLARTDGDPAALLPAIRRAIRAADPGQPIGRLATHEAILGATIAQPRFLLAVIGAFGAIALVLAMLGVFGLVAYRTAQRRREVGIRLALGARRTGIMAVVLRRGLALVALGAASGLVAATLLGRLVADALHGVSPYDPRTYLAATAGVLLAGLAACWLPASRASRISPVEALRHE
jgi:ABC-type antimicrobial peptide transport system permease subunit